VKGAGSSKQGAVVAVFSGGGAKALAHAGAFRALKERGLVPDRIIGTSLGAVIGAMLACGMTYEEVLVRVGGVQVDDVAMFSPTALLGYFSESFLQAGPLRRTIERLIPRSGFEQLDFSLTVTATDAESGGLTLFGTGGDSTVPLHEALYASCALPLYYPAAEVRGRKYLDGGIRAVLPLEVVNPKEWDVVVAVDVGPRFDAAEPKERAPLPPLVRAGGNALNILMATQTEAVLKLWKPGKTRFVLVRPPVEKESTFALGRTAQYAVGGYEETLKALDQ
jgi:NTE family protein